VALAALRARRPLVLHEQNAIPGLANRTLARPARAVALAFPEARRAFPRRTRTIITGNPVREAVLEVPHRRAELAEVARRDLGLAGGGRTVVVFGGSQGALNVNRSMAEALWRLGAEDIQVLLLAGPVHVETVAGSLPTDGHVPVRVLGYLERMELAYAVADLVVARSGATTVAELAVCGLPSILIPYPYATGRHQEANARALQRAGAAWMLLDDQLDGRVLAERIDRLLADPERLETMGERARAWARPDAAGALAGVVLEAGGGS
jgi:UDP-N-acetylglucosamine--N-acetylmuramyl-(pentapeptide) pyrophosphoryl-undecaprenol N-acetylglucosamine transferase